MLKFMKNYPSMFADSFNDAIMEKSFDRPLVEYVLDAWRSLEIVQGIKFLGYDYTEEMSDIEINDYIVKRYPKGVSKDKRYDYKFVDDTKVGLLKVYLLLTSYEMDYELGKMVEKQKKITKSLLIPLQDEDGYYFVNGKKYYLIYQMVEKSTYTAANSVILKSLMPFAIRRKTVDAEDMKGNLYTLPYYTVELYRKDYPVMLIYASKGLDYAIQFAIQHYPYVCMDFTTEYNENDDKYIYFGISTKLFLKVRKSLFEKYIYIQSVVGGLLEICSNRLTESKLNDETIWIKKLSQSNMEKGKNLLNSLKRLLDETTKKNLRVDLYNKMDVLSVIRWMTQEFNDLRAKDNMDLCNKRLRCNEMLASLITYEFSIRLNQILTLGQKATIEDLKKIFKFTPELLIQKMHTSGIFRYDENINDLDVFSRFKYTNKGPHSAGSKNKKSIGVNYRGLHPSFIGYIDMTVCGNSDPGTSGTLVPYSDMNSFYFDDNNEPENFGIEFIKDMENILNEDGISAIKISFENKEDYFSILNNLHLFINDGIKVSCTSREHNYDVILEDDEDMEKKKK